MCPLSTFPLADEQILLAPSSKYIYTKLLPLLPPPSLTRGLIHYFLIWHYCSEALKGNPVSAVVWSVYSQSSDWRTLLKVRSCFPQLKTFSGFPLHPVKPKSLKSFAHFPCVSQIYLFSIADAARFACFHALASKSLHLLHSTRVLLNGLHTPAPPNLCSDIPFFREGFPDYTALNCSTPYALIHVAFFSP